MEILLQYKSEIDVELKFDEMNIKQCQLRLPGIKHKWVSRLIQHKIALKRLKQSKKDIIDQLIRKSEEDTVVKMSRVALVNAAGNTQEIRTIDNNIADEEIVIEYLEKVEKIMSNATFDIKNVVELIKMETL